MNLRAADPLKHRLGHAVRISVWDICACPLEVGQLKVGDFGLWASTAGLCVVDAAEDEHLLVAD